MSKHRHVRNIIGAYIYGDLKPEEMREVREHLDECATCRQDAESQAKVIACIPDAARPLMEVDRQRIRWSVLGAVRRESAQSSRRVAVWRLLRGFSAAGVMACIFVVGLFVGARQFRPAEAPIRDQIRGVRPPAPPGPVAPTAVKQRPNPPVNKPAGFVVKTPAGNRKMAQASQRGKRYHAARERRSPHRRNLPAPPTRMPERPDEATTTFTASAAGFEPESKNGRAVVPTSKDDARPMILPTEGN